MKSTLFFAALLTGCAAATAVGNDIATACADTAGARAALGLVLSGNPLLLAVNAGCTLDGQAAMAIKDTQPVTVSNSGHSAVWVKATVAALQTAKPVAK